MRNDAQYLTVALTKGRLAKTTLALFEKAGYDTSCVTAADSRRLIFTDEKNRVRYFLAKGPDVPTYVAYGAADLGVSGRDTILEEGRPLYEVLDLKTGCCRMCVCGPESARALLDSGKMVRVATKYPEVAKDYFYNQCHRNVEIIRLSGSIELAPIVGPSEVIVDIVETGATLRENGLCVLETITDLSARVVVNQVSLTMKRDRIETMIRALRKAVHEDRKTDE